MVDLESPLLYTPRFSLKVFLVEIFKRFFTIYGNGGHLVQWCKTISTNCQYPFYRRLHVKSGENWSSSFREEDFKDYKILNMYVAKGQGRTTVRG